MLLATFCIPQLILITTHSRKILPSSLLWYHLPGRLFNFLGSTFSYPLNTFMHSEETDNLLKAPANTGLLPLWLNNALFSKPGHLGDNLHLYSKIMQTQHSYKKPWDTLVKRKKKKQQTLHFQSAYIKLNKESSLLLISAGLLCMIHEIWPVKVSSSSTPLGWGVHAGTAFDSL